MVPCADTFGADDSGHRRPTRRGLCHRWRDVDWEHSELLIRRSTAIVKGQAFEKDTKIHQARRVSIDEATRELLREHRLRSRVDSASSVQGW